MDGTGEKLTKDYTPVLKFLESYESIPAELMGDPRPTNGIKGGETHSPNELIARAARFLVLNNMGIIQSLPLRSIEEKNLMFDIARTRRSLEGFVDKINLMCGYTGEIEMAETEAEVLFMAEQLGLDKSILFVEEDVYVLPTEESYPWFEEPADLDGIEEDDEKFDYLYEQASAA